MEEKFVKYLIEIGIIDIKTENQILTLYREKNSYFKINNFKFNEIMTELLLNLFENLTEIQKKYICFHLPVKFLKLTQNLLKQKLKNILIKTILKKKYILAKYLFRWNKNFHKEHSKKLDTESDNNQIVKFLNILKNIFYIIEIIIIKVIIMKINFLKINIIIWPRIQEKGAIHIEIQKKIIF